MITNILAMLTNSLSYAVYETERLLNAMGAMGVVLTAFMIYSSYRFFLKPLVGGAGSDRARRKSSKGNNDD